MAKRKILALLLMTVVCCILMVSCPQDPDALPKGVYRLTIKGGASLEEDKMIYYSTSENEWYTSKEITDANKLTNKQLYGDKVPEGYSFVIKFNDKDEEPIVGEKVAFTGAKAGDTVVLDATGELKLVSLTESKTAVLLFASPTSEPTAQALPYKAQKDNNLFLGWGVNSDEASAKTLKAEAKMKNIVVPYTPKKGEAITLDSSWGSLSTPSGAYSYKADEKEKALETFQKNYSIIWYLFVRHAMSVYPKFPEGVAAKQEYPEYNGEIYSFDNVSFEVEIPNDNAKKVAVKNASGIIAQCVYGEGEDYYSGNLENYISMTFTIDEKLPIYNMYADGEGYADEKNYFELSPKTYKIEAYFIGTRDSKDPMRIIPDSTKIWVIENGKSYSFKDVDLT